MTAVHWLALLALSLPLTSCAPAPATTPAPAAAPAAVLQAVLNAERAARGLPAVRANAVLDRAAGQHAADMARRGYFDHRSPEGRGPAERLRQLGYGYCLVAENIARGQPGRDEVMTSWMQSPGHRANILARGVSEFGIARVMPGPVWVLVLARPGC